LIESLINPFRRDGAASFALTEAAAGRFQGLDDLGAADSNQTIQCLLPNSSFRIMQQLL